MPRNLLERHHHMEHVEHTHESNIRRMDAEIGKLLAETARITDERRKMDAEIAKLAKKNQLASHDGNCRCRGCYSRNHQAVFYLTHNRRPLRG